VPWSKRRRLFLVEQLLFLACVAAGVVLVFAISGVSGKIIVAVCLFAIMIANIILRYTYFRNVLPELRQERDRRRS
jgi:uncharacterized membrane protein